MNDRDGEALLGWFRENGRDLPWRHTRDPWAILLAEAMSQQTQLARVIPRWSSFLHRWPTAASMADGTVAEVITAWAGLGYNRRARDLHRAAVRIRDEFAGTVPDSLEELMTLPGVGPYTARAVLVFAFEADGAGVLDTNVARILARRGGRRLGRAEAQRCADEAVPAGRSWAWNQAMLDLGAVVCRPRNPGCEVCPFDATCAWRAAGRPEPDPAIGSAGVSGRQSRFEGSDRQGRGRLLDALRIAPVPDAVLPEVMGWPDDERRARRVAGSLVDDGLAVRGDDGMLRLPG